MQRRGPASEAGMDRTTAFSWVWLLRNAPGSSTLLARPTLSCSAAKSLCCMFAPITQEHEHRIIQNAKIGESFTAPQSSSLTGVDCCSGSSRQRPRFSSDREVYQSRQATIEKSRKLSLVHCKS